MKREILILILIFPILFFYIFSDSFYSLKKKKHSFITLGGSFETLLGSRTEDWGYIQTQEDSNDISFYTAMYEENKNAQFNSRFLFKIPKTVHMIWLGPSPFPIESVKNVRSWVAHHPDWTFIFWTDRKCPPPCKEMEVKYIDDFDFDFLEKPFFSSRNWREKSDLLRYEILYKEGGLYIDHNMRCVRPFHGLHKGYDFYACLEMPHEEIDMLRLTVGNAIIGCKPMHPVIRGAIQSVLDRWEEETSKFLTLEPLVHARLAAHRTYIPFTLSIKKHINALGNTDIIFPAAYFYPKHNLPGFYSYYMSPPSFQKHKESESEKFFSRIIQFFKDRDMKLIRFDLLSLFALIGSLILYFLMNKDLKKILGP